MSATLLARSGSQRARPALSVLGAMDLAWARVHEICGPSRRMLALQVAAALSGPVFWISPAWMPDKLYPDGVARIMDPTRITYLTPKRPEDLLWCTEEILRAGLVPLVVADLPGPPALTPIRRLHLAAEAGTSLTKIRALGLILTPADGGAQGVESRWHITPRHTPNQSLWQLERRRARTAPQAAWQVTARAGQGLKLTPTAVEGRHN